MGSLIATASAMTAMPPYGMARRTRSGRSWTANSTSDCTASSRHSAPMSASFAELTSGSRADAAIAGTAAAHWYAATRSMSRRSSSRRRTRSTAVSPSGRRPRLAVGTGGVGQRRDLGSHRVGAVDGDAPAPGLLGAVQRAVGGGEQRLGRLDALAALCDAAADGERDGPGRRAAADPSGEAARDALGRRGIGAGQRQGELLAPDAPEEVAVAQVPARHVDERPQRRVPGRVAVLVVDLLEVVEVEQHEGQPVAAIEEDAQLVLERPAVRDARQAVAPGRVLQAAGDVVQAGDERVERLAQEPHDERGEHDGERGIEPEVQAGGRLEEHADRDRRAHDRRAQQGDEVAAGEGVRAQQQRPDRVEGDAVGRAGDGTHSSVVTIPYRLLTRNSPSVRRRRVAMMSAHHELQPDDEGERRVVAGVGIGPEDRAGQAEDRARVHHDGDAPHRGEVDGAGVLRPVSDLRQSHPHRSAVSAAA